MTLILAYIRAGTCSRRSSNQSRCLRVRFGVVKGTAHSQSSSTMSLEVLLCVLVAARLGGTKTDRKQTDTDRQTQQTDSNRQTETQTSV